MRHLSLDLLGYHDRQIPSSTGYERVGLDSVQDQVIDLVPDQVFKLVPDAAPHLVPDMVPDLQPDMVPDLQPIFCNKFVVKHGIRYASSSVARSVTRRGARSCIISPDLPPIGTQGALNTSQHAELKLIACFPESLPRLAWRTTLPQTPTLLA